MACPSRPAQGRRPGLATNTDFKIENGGSGRLMACDWNISAIVWPEDRDIFLEFQINSARTAQGALRTRLLVSFNVFFFYGFKKAIVILYSIPGVRPGFELVLHFYNMPS